MGLEADKLEFITNFINELIIYELFDSIYVQLKLYINPIGSSNKMMKYYDYRNLYY
jgi:hypothetical protein